MVLIESLEGRQIINSSGAPAVEVTLHLTDKSTVTASAPSGLSKSSHEAVELFDKDFSVYFGKGIEHALENVNKIIAPRMKKLDPMEQFKIDQILIELDGTPNMSHLGSNATLPVSIAAARAAAKIQRKELYEHLNHLFLRIEAFNFHEEPVNIADDRMKPKLPIPAFSVINGGMVGDTSIGIEDLFIFPVGLTTSKDQIRAAAEISFELRKVLKSKGLIVNTGERGGYVTTFDNPYQPLEAMIEAVGKTNYQVHNKILYGFDVAGSHIENALPDDFLDNVLRKYPILLITDAFDEEDWEDFATLNKAYPRIFVAGDDITSTNIERLYTAISHNAIDSVVVKPNQIGTVTETLRFMKVAKDAMIELFVADRAAETEDTFIVDLAIATQSRFLNAGNLARGERVSKYNRFLKLAERFEI